MKDYKKEILEFYIELKKYYRHLRDTDAPEDLCIHVLTKMSAIEQLMRKLQIEYKDIQL